MSLKLSYNGEIHKLQKIPASFAALLEVTHSLFGSTLPKEFSLHYEDSEGDKIVIHSDEDLKALIEVELAASTKSTKIYVTPKSQSSQPDEIIIQKETKILENKLDSSSISRASTNKEEIREAVTDLIYEQVPTLANLLKEMLNDSVNLQQSHDTKKTSTSQQQQKVVHQMVTCDGCGVNPVVGLRYKCSVCTDFDFCENCEENVKHEHPFIKIKEAVSYQGRHHGHHGFHGHRGPHGRHGPGHGHGPFGPFGGFQPFGGTGFGLGGGFGGENGCHQFKEMFKDMKKEWKEQCQGQQKEGCNPFQNPLAQMAAEFYKNMPQDTRDNINGMFNGVPDTLLAQFESMKVDEPKPETKEEPKLDFSFVKEVAQIPASLTLKDKTFYKSIVLKNTGTKDWPKTVFLASNNEVKGLRTNLSAVEPGKEASIILTIESPALGGKYFSSWKLGYTDESGKDVFIGKPFDLGFEIVSAEESTPSGNEKKEEEKTIPQPKVYSEKVKNTAKLLKELFPEQDLDKLLETVEKNEKLTVEELIENFLVQY